MPDQNTLLKTAIIASIAAGQEIMAVYKDVIEVTLKDDRSPLTLADRKSHLKITEFLKETGLPVLSEEGKQVPFEERKNWKQFWMIDPLDGTKEFIKKNGEFTVNIALIVDNRAMMGVIYAPDSDTLYFGASWLPGKMIYNVSEYMQKNIPDSAIMEKLISVAIGIPVINTNRPYTVVASRSHLSPETSSFVQSLEEKHGQLSFISKGSSLKICLVAEGVADIYPRLAPTMEWDTAAGQAIA